MIKDPETRVILWKFEHLDRNRDGYLGGKELRKLLRGVRRMVRPRSCAKRFRKSCDHDHDRKITQREWFLCLGVDIHMLFQSFLALNPMNLPTTPVVTTSSPPSMYLSSTLSDSLVGSDPGLPAAFARNIFGEIMTNREAAALVGKKLATLSQQNMSIANDTSSEDMHFKNDSGNTAPSKVMVSTTTPTATAEVLITLVPPSLRTPDEPRLSDSPIGFGTGFGAESGLLGTPIDSGRSPFRQSGSFGSGGSGGGGGLFGSLYTKRTTEAPDPLKKRDCITQREKALHDQAHNHSAHNYIPECVGPGNVFFKNKQCHPSSGYCWCANTITGRPIRYTAVRYTQPNCDDAMDRVPENVQINRQKGIKKCKRRKRKLFYQRLYVDLASGMEASSQNLNSNITMSLREASVRWKFHSLDKNGNGRWERREWKGYRKALKKWKGVKRCGRNFLRYCDSNTDRKITLSEWLQCALEDREPEPRRFGLNPFEHILTADD